MTSRNDSSSRLCALLAACVVVGAASIPGVALALQQQVVGGHALDANLQVDGSGLNTARASNRVGGMQSNAYSARRQFGGGSGLSSQAYRPANYSRQYGRGSTGGFTLNTGYGNYSTGSGRADPLRVSQYSVLQTGALVERGVIPGGGRSAASPRGMTTPRPTYNAYRLPNTGRVPSTGLTSTKYSVARRN
jgi:hypothetical protein